MYYTAVQGNFYCQFLQLRLCGCWLRKRVCPATLPQRDSFSWSKFVKDWRAFCQSDPSSHKFCFLIA